MTDDGVLGAFITKVKKGSIADTVGRLRPGMIGILMTVFYTVEPEFIATV